ncbi:hypothetical protein NM203_15515 [Mycolicibacterium sp. CAU 1645]|uniref:Uncharacterized protein n=2 Tax=Mycolicibacterium arenosum TaxID=2952157 RepID=A0ABT1M721_9MYCO|nr:hypothetical protein [Mycolicibacterium sp. CAU 1645]
MRHYTVAAPAPQTPEEATRQQCGLLPDDDPSVTVLFAEVDAILCAAAAACSPRRPPAPPAAGCVLRGPRPAGRTSMRTRRRWTSPVGDVLAVQRSPPKDE